MTPEPNVEQVVPFLWVKNLEASLPFYVEGLGFTMTKKWILYTPLCHNQAVIRAVDVTFILCPVRKSPTTPASFTVGANWSLNCFSVRNWLNLHNQAALDTMVQQMYDKTSANYHQTATEICLDWSSGPRFVAWAGGAANAEPTVSARTPNAAAKLRERETRL
jgi:hypothetical protein